jgi:hypothetical protein
VAIWFNVDFHFALELQVIWVIGLLLLYPFCRWFAEVKRRRRDWWLSYL